VLSELRTRPLLALCIMVLSPSQYVAQGSASKSHQKKQPKAIQSSSRSRAEAIIQTIISHLGILKKDLYKVFIDSLSLVDAGDVVDLGDCLAEFSCSS
jgi:hypothetical protein